MAIIDRREFLKLVGAGGVGAGAGFMLADSIKHPVEYLIPAVVPPEDYSPGVVAWYNSVCNMCSAGCGISVRSREGRPKKIEGNPAHPVNQGKLCALGQSGLQVLYNPDRLAGPLSRVGGRGLSVSSPAKWQPATWDAGLDRVSSAIQELLSAGRGSSICVLSRGLRGHQASLLELFMAQLGSDQLLHYDFDHPHALYVANQDFFGERALPYYDIANTQYLLSFGADFLGSWLSPVHYSLGLGRSRQGQEAFRGHLVQIEPRMSLTGAAADQWLAPLPGTEGIVALGLAQQIVSSGHYRGKDRRQWQTALQVYSPARVAAQTGVPESTLTELATAFVEQPSLAIGDSGHSNAVATLTAINALNYLAGNIGRRGGVLFNSPPAIEANPGQGAHFRQASFRRMRQLAEDARRGDIQLLIINDTNPLFTLPQVVGFREAMAQIPLVVSLSSFMDESTADADLILPSHTYLESWGDDFPEPGVGFPVGAVSQPVVAPLYDTRASGDTLLALASRLGFSKAMPWKSMQEYLVAGWRQLYQRGAADSSDGGFEPFWRELLQAGVWGVALHRDISPALPDPALVEAIGVAPPVFPESESSYPLLLHPYLSTALQDGRGANLPWLQELPDAMTSVVYGSWLELNPVTAKHLGLTEGDLVTVESAHGSLVAPVYIYPAIRPDVVAMPIGQGHSEYGRYARGRGQNPLHILTPQEDAASGALARCATRVKLTATGNRIALVKTGGTSRQLGRNIIQTTVDHRRSGTPVELIPAREV